MGDVFQPLKMLGLDGVQVKTNEKLEFSIANVSPTPYIGVHLP